MGRGLTYSSIIEVDESQTIPGGFHTLQKIKNAFPAAAWLQKYLKFAPVRPIDNPKPSAAGTVAGRSLGAAMRRVAGNTHNLIYYLQTAQGPDDQAPQPLSGMIPMRVVD